MNIYNNINFIKLNKGKQIKVFSKNTTCRHLNGLLVFNTSTEIGLQQCLKAISTCDEIKYMSLYDDYKLNEDFCILTNRYDL